MSIEEFENNRWRSKDQKMVFRHQAAAEMIDAGRVLDLGCGDGLFLDILKSRGLGVHGLDLSIDAIKKCQQKGIQSEVYDFASKPLPFEDNAFDYVVLLDVLEHLYYPEKVLKEAARVSSKFVIVSVPNFNALPARIQVFRGDVPENNRLHKGHIFWFNLRNLRKILGNAKLITLDLKTNTFWSNKAVIGKITRFLSLVRPSVFALSFVVKAEKNLS